MARGQAQACLSVTVRPVPVPPAIRAALEPLVVQRPG
jgi:hypothetical protein